MNIDLDTWIISDTHFGHNNIIRFCNRPVYHDELMVVNWFQTVRPEDTVLHLGDVGFGTDAARFLGGRLEWNPDRARELPGKKYLIKGNHDTKADWYYEGFGFEIIEPFGLWFPDPGVVGTDRMRMARFLHDPLDAKLNSPTFDARRDVFVHGHIHNNGYHPRCPEDIDYRNVSVEVMDYRPVRLRDVLYNGKYQSRKDAGINEYDAAKLKEHA
jgi:calcineurin-like phosphoesterase family protein